MARSVRYHPLFESDVLDAADWYDQRSPDLGATFIIGVQKAVAQLVGRPEIQSNRDFGIRYWFVERFPYVVFYDFTEVEIQVLGVMHTAQNADKWLSRRS